MSTPCSPLRRLASLPALLVAAALLLGSPGAWAESTQAAGDPKASAQLNFRINIPAVLRLELNQHPLHIHTRPGEPAPELAKQQLVMYSNLRGGACVQLRLTQPQVQQWDVQLADPESASLVPAGDGSYRLCTQRIGRSSIALVHRFDATSPLGALPWPVQTDLSAI